MCPGCARGDCFSHVDEFINVREFSRIEKCKCPDPQGQHGKLRPRTPHDRRRQKRKGDK